MPRAGGNILDSKFMYEYYNLDWDTAIDVPIDPIIQNDWYEALVDLEDVKAYYLVIEQTNNGAAVEDIEVEITLNGVPYIYAGAAMASGVPAYLRFGITAVINGPGVPMQMVALDADQSAPLETRLLSIRVRQTTPVDAVSAIIDVNLAGATKEVT